MIGKRKRDEHVVLRRKNETKFHESEIYTSADSSEMYRRHFEATFAPLPEQPTKVNVAETERNSDSSDTQSEVSEWSGLSESSTDLPVVEVVDHAIAGNAEEDEFHRARQKAFMSSRPPHEVQTTNTTKRPQDAEQDDPAEKLNLKHDLDLQRLLKESHLLEKSKASAAPGKERQQALDLRLQALGAKDSIFAQQKMPVAHRVGIAKKADSKEAKRRKDAKDNGVILEKVTKKGSNNVRRERGVDVPGVGRFTGGTLKLSRRDVAGIQGSPTTTKRKGKGR